MSVLIVKGIIMKKNRLYEFKTSQLLRFNKLFVIGDLHGDLNALQSLLTKIDPAKDCIIFLGDYADRGSFGIEIIDVISSLTKKYPDNIVALKGNHEDYTKLGQPTFYPCDLINEAIRMRESWETYFFREFNPFIKNLYLAAIIPHELLFVHGGISSKITSIDDLRHPAKEIEKDILWSDPLDKYGEYPNRRGAGVEFGIDVTTKTCKMIGIKKIIRSHEPQKALRGPCYEHNGKIVTTSSTSVYGGNPFILDINPKNFFDTSFLF